MHDHPASLYLLGSICALGFVVAIFAQPPEVLPRLTRVAAFPTEGGGIADLACVDRGTKLVTLGDSGDLILWDVATLCPITNLPDVEGYGGSLALHPTLPVLAVSGRGAAVVLHDLETGIRESIELGSTVQHLAWSSNGDRLAAQVLIGEEWGVAILYGLDRPVRGEPRAAPAPRRWLPAPVRFRDYVMLVGEDLHLCADEFPVSSRKLDLTQGLPSVTIEDGRVPVGVSDGELVFVQRDADSRRPTMRLGDRTIDLDGVESLACIAVGDGQAAWAPRHSQTVWHLAKGADRPHPLRLQVDGWIERLVLAADGTVIGIDTGHLLHVWRGGRHDVVGGHRGQASGLAFSPDGRYLAACGWGATVIADLHGTVLAEFRGKVAVAPGPTGSEFFVAERHQVQVWSAATGKPVRAVASREDPPIHFSGSPSSVDDGLRIQALAGATHLLLRTSLLSGDLVLEERFELLSCESGRFAGLDSAPASIFPFGFATPVTSAAQPCGQQVAIGFQTPRRLSGSLVSKDANQGTLEIHDATGTRLLGEDFRNGITAVAYSPDGAHLITADAAGTLHIYDSHALRQIQSVKIDECLHGICWTEPGRLIAYDDERLLVITVPEFVVRDWILLPEPTPPCEAVMGGRHGSAPCVAFSPEGTHIAIVRQQHVEIYRLGFGDGR